MYEGKLVFAQVMEHLPLHAALVFLVARVVYVPAYVISIAMLRSFVWLAGVASLVMMALPLI